MNNSGGFSPYMLICSTLQAVFGFDRRSEQDKQADIAEQHQLALIKAKEEFQNELEAQKVADMRAKMAVARQYRSEERFEQTVLQHKNKELREFFYNYLPIKPKSIPTLLDEAVVYKMKGYNIECPLNVILLHTRQNELNYEEIYDDLDKVGEKIGNVVYRRWCDKDIARNSSILNLHAIMGNIPTVVISPYYQGGAIHFTASMWEAQSDAKPMIRPLFSIQCLPEYLSMGQKFTDEGKKVLQERIALVSTIVSGCARDSYMLMTQGMPPTLPQYLKENPKVMRALMEPQNKELCAFMISEYQSAHASLNSTECASNLLTKEEMKVLAEYAKNAERELLEQTKKAVN